MFEIDKKIPIIIVERSLRFVRIKPQVGDQIPIWGGGLKLSMGSLKWMMKKGKDASSLGLSSHLFIAIYLFSNYLYRV